MKEGEGVLVHVPVYIAEAVLLKLRLYCSDYSYCLSVFASLFTKGQLTVPTCIIRPCKPDRAVFHP